MKQKSNILKSLTVAAALAAGGTSIASATGLVGQRYFEATYDHVYFDNKSGLDDGNGLSLTLNHPLTTGVDLGLSYSYLSSGTAGVSTHGNEFVGYGTFYGTSGNTKPYARVGLGWDRASAGGFSNSETVYLLEGGLEWKASSKSTLTPWLNWTAPFNNDVSGTFTYGLTGEYELTPKVSLIAKVSGNNDSDWGLSAGALFRF